MKTHSLDEKFKCDLCAKTFHMKWRLVKHRSQHDLTSVRFCHYFNNNKFCSFYELGCMFKHEHAPICKNGMSCRTKLCQFTHQVVMETHSEESSENEIDTEVRETEEPIVYPCSICGFVSKTEAYLPVHISTKHKVNGNDIDNALIEEENDSDDDDVDDGPMECNHCLINGVKPGFTCDDFELLLQHIWNDHKENSVWGPSH